MKTITEKVNKAFDRDLCWTRLIFSNNNETKKTQVLTCASLKYIKDLNQIGGDKHLGKEQLKSWLNDVIKKWTDLGADLFNQDIHYDVYAKTKKGETNGLDFLLTKI